MSNRPKFLLVCLLFVLALFIRFQYIDQLEIDSPIRADAKEYVVYGYNLFHHGIFSKEFPSAHPRPDSFRSPGYPMLIALCSFIGGEQGLYPVILSLQAVLSALLVPLTFLVGICIFSEAWAFVAALFVAISPHLISISGYVLTETLFGFCLLLSIFFFLRAYLFNSLLMYIFAAFVFGLAYLTNETAFFVPYLLISLVVFSKRSRVDEKTKVPWRNIFLFLMVFSLFPFSWVLRNNISLSSEVQLNSSRAISTLSHGAYPDFIYKTDQYRYIPYCEDPMQPEFGSSLENFAIIFWERFKQRPWRYLSWYLFEKPYYFWSWDILQGQGDVFVYPVKTSLYHKSTLANITRVFMKGLHPLILLLTLAGVLFFFYSRCYPLKNHYIHRDCIVFLFIILVYFTGLYTVFASWSRYSIPLRPELYLFALWSFKNFKQSLMEK